MLNLSWIPKFADSADKVQTHIDNQPQGTFNSNSYPIGLPTASPVSPPASYTDQPFDFFNGDHARTRSEESSLTMPSLNMSVCESDYLKSPVAEFSARAFSSQNYGLSVKLPLDADHAPQLPAAPQSLPVDEEDLKHEQKCVFEAKTLLTRCVIGDQNLNQYKLTMLLGYGTFGIVVQGERLSDNLRVAIKIMRKNQIHHTRLCKDPRTNQASCLEIALLKYSPPHDNLIKYIDSWETPECWFLVTEQGGHPWNRESLDPLTKLPLILTKLFFPRYKCPPTMPNFPQEFERMQIITGVDSCPKQCIIIPKFGNDQSLAGLLRVCGGFSKKPKFMRKRGPILPEPVQKRIMLQILDVVDSLHKCGIAHKDLKDENILVDSDLNVKLIDFGHAAFYQTSHDNPQIKPFKSYGTPIFSPPEVRSGLPFIGPEADVYAMGLMIYEMNNGDLPDNFDEAFYKQNGQCIFDISSNCGFSDSPIRDLVQQMLSPDPLLRPTVDQVRNHSWFKTL